MRSAARSLLLCALAFVLGASGPSDEIDRLRHARALSDELMSPFCPGRTLSDCPSPNASAVREEIRGWLAQGRTDAEIRADLRERFGAVVVGEPEGVWGWMAPLAALVVLGLFFVLAARRIVAPAAAPEDPGRD